MENDMFKESIRKWKLHRDDMRDGEIKRHLRAYWFKFRRHDQLVNLLLETDFSNDDLEQLSNMLGQLAHDRERKLNG
jgi:hypothetical protein|tara:strand:- start:255 stop:485 length:231 start_codon:yes stop_codon:yes gene_type:complete